MRAAVSAGVATIVIITRPQRADQAIKPIPMSCGASFAVALPPSSIVTKRIAGSGTA
ncbi:MAG: hypothetical protein ACOYLQ_18565 [Hyphomicrobiaceae bacterium]